MHIFKTTYSIILYVYNYIYVRVCVRALCYVHLHVYGLFSFELCTPVLTPTSKTNIGHFMMDAVIRDMKMVKLERKMADDRRQW